MSTVRRITPDIGEMFLHKGQLFTVHSWAKPNPQHDPSYVEPPVTNDADFVRNVKNSGKLVPHVHATRREATHVHGISGRGEVVLPISDVRIDPKYDYRSPQLADRRRKLAGYAAMEHPIEMMNRFEESTDGDSHAHQAMRGMQQHMSTSEHPTYLFWERLAKGGRLHAGGTEPQYPAGREVKEFTKRVRRNVSGPQTGGRITHATFEYEDGSRLQVHRPHDTKYETIKFTPIAPASRTESAADALISAKLREGSLPEKESLHTVALSHGYRPHREVGGTRVYRNPNGHEISVDRSGWSHYTPGATSAGRGTGVTELSVHLRAQRKPQTEEHTGASVMPGNRSRSYVLSRLSDYVYGRDKGLGLPGHNSVPLGLTPGGHEVPGLAARAYNDSHPSAFGRLAILQHVQDKHASSEPRRSMIADHVRSAFPGWTQNDHLAAVEGHRAAALDALDRHQAFTKMHDPARLSPAARGRFKIAQKQLELDHANHLRIAAAHEDVATREPDRMGSL